MHERCDGNSDGLPIGEFFFHILYSGHLPGGAVCNQAERGESQVVCIDTVKTGGIAAAAVIAVKMQLGF